MIYGISLSSSLYTVCHWKEHSEENGITPMVDSGIVRSRDTAKTHPPKYKCTGESITGEMEKQSLTPHTGPSCPVNIFVKLIGSVRNFEPPRPPPLEKATALVRPKPELVGGLDLIFQPIRFLHTSCQQRNEEGQDGIPFFCCKKKQTNCN